MGVPGAATAFCGYRDDALSAIKFIPLVWILLNFEFERATGFEPADISLEG